MMRSLILQTFTRLLVTLMLLFSLFLLWRGHNLPGGGFIGALVASSAFALHAIAFGVASAREILRFDPRVLMAWGMIFAVVAGLFGLAVGKPFMAGLWVELPVGASVLKLGTPLIFDIGVFLTVIGMVVAVIFSLEEQEF